MLGRGPGQAAPPRPRHVRRPRRHHARLLLGVRVADVAGDLVQAVVEVREPGVRARGAGHRAGARAGRQAGVRGGAGAGAGARAAAGAGLAAAGVVHHGVVVGVLAPGQRRLLVAPGLPVRLRVVVAGGVPLGVGAGPLPDEGGRGVARGAAPVAACGVTI